MFTIALILIGTTKTSAMLQANATTHANPKSGTFKSWWGNIRKMEESGQTMGLVEQIGNDSVSTIGEDNGIDVHHMKPSEFGAVAILSASGYGNANKLRYETDPLKRTTTGNATGVYFTGDRREFVAGGNDGGVAKYWENLANWENIIGVSRGWHDGSYETFQSISNGYTWGTNHCLVAGFNGIFGVGYLRSSRTDGYNAYGIGYWDGAYNDFGHGWKPAATVNIWNYARGSAVLLS